MTRFGTSGAVHALLLRQAANAPNDLLVRARLLLADRGVLPAAELCLRESARLVLTESDRVLLEDVMALREPRNGTAATAEPRALAWRFSSATTEPPDEAVAAVLIALLTQESGAVALWQAWRSPVGQGPSSAPQAVYIAEVAGADPAAATGRLVRALLDFGVVSPEVEVLVSGDQAPAYQRLARESATLLWSARPAPDLRFARIGDCGEDGLPLFPDDHPVVPFRDRLPLLNYLRAAPVVLSVAARDLDVAVPERGRSVPLTLRTDGTWIFSDAVGYYLRLYGLAPERDLLDHIEAAAGPPAPDSVALHRALHLLEGRA